MQVNQIELREYMRLERLKIWFIIMLSGIWIEFLILFTLVMLPSHPLLPRFWYAGGGFATAANLANVFVAVGASMKREKVVRAYVAEHGQLPRSAVLPGHWIALVLAYVLGFVGFCIWVASTIQVIRR